MLGEGVRCILFFGEEHESIASGSSIRSANEQHPFHSIHHIAWILAGREKVQLQNNGTVTSD